MTDWNEETLKLFKPPEPLLDLLLEKSDVKMDVDKFNYFLFLDEIF